MKRWLVWILAAVILCATAGVALAIYTAVQTLQPVPANGILPLCPNPRAWGVTSVPVGSTGYVYFECQGNPLAAFVYYGGTVTPTYSLPAPYTSLWVIGERTPFPPYTTCIDAFPVGIWATQSGQPMDPTMNVGSYYGYCADYSNVTIAGLPAVQVTWSWP